MGLTFAIIVATFLPLIANTLTSWLISTSLLPHCYCFCVFSPKKSLYFLKLLTIFLRSGILPLGTIICHNIAKNSISKLLSKLLTRLLNISLHQLEIAKISNFSYFPLIIYLKTRFLKINRIQS